MQALMLLLWTGVLLGSGRCQNNAGSPEVSGGGWGGWVGVGSGGGWGGVGASPQQAPRFQARPLHLDISKTETMSCPTFQRTEWGQK